VEISARLLSIFCLATCKPAQTQMRFEQNFCKSAGFDDTTQWLVTSQVLD
jgi:hypothetical protein